MRIVNLLLTTVVLFPFTVLAGYYFFFALWKTLRDPPELTTWKSRVYFGGMVVVHVASIVLFFVTIYLAIYAGIGVR